MTEWTVADYGSWDSPITSQQLVGGNCKTISELRASPDGCPFWLEQTFPHGKKVLFGLDNDGQAVQWTSSNLSISNGVHEYGGGSLCVASDTGRVFVCHSGGVWTLAGPGAEPKPVIGCEPGQDVRHGDIFAHANFVYAVQEVHYPQQQPDNRLVRLNVHDGKCEVLSEGADFYAGPRVSPDGCWLAWIQWNNPYMSWENTEVHVMALGSDGPLLGTDWTILANGRSNYALAWTRQGPALWMLSDIEGQWNVHHLDHTKGVVGQGLIPAELGEIGHPLWLFDLDRPYVMFDTVAERGHRRSAKAVVAVGDSLLELFNDNESKHRRFGSVQRLGFTVFHQLCLSPDERKLFCLASGPQRAVSLLRVDLTHGHEAEPYAVHILRETRNHDELSRLPISVPESLCFESDGVQVQGFFYAPCSHSHRAPPDQLPPALLVVHGGPTSRTTNAIDMKVQYFTSRGFAVFDINYRGSSGFGRKFRDYLNGQWGVVDRDDMVNGAKFLISTGRCDPKRVCIMGSSAGGFTVLSVLMHPDKVFAAGVSLYGVTDLEGLYKTSHKFEKENTAKLIAPYPSGIDTYRRRSPLNNIELLQVPVAFLHGTDDPVVPMAQSIACHERLKAKGVPTLLKLFPDEAHGFRKADSIAQAADIAYCFLCKATGIRPSGDIPLEIDNM